MAPTAIQPLGIKVEVTIKKKNGGKLASFVKTPTFTMYAYSTYVKWHKSSQVQFPHMFHHLFNMFCPCFGIPFHLSFPPL